MKEIKRDFWKKWEERDNFIYLPVIFGSLLNKSYFEEWRETMFYFNYLISGYEFDKSMLKQIDCFEYIKQRGLFLSDSGGFQVFSFGAFINPRKLVRYQTKLTNMGFILDSPPYRPIEGKNKGLISEFDFDNFDEHLQKTIRWTKMMLEDLDDSEFSLGGIIHGVSYDTMNKWYDSIMDLYDFKFWGLGIKPPNDLFRLTKFLKFIEEKKIKSIHLLAVSGVRAILFLLYYQRFLYKDVYITFDSSTPIRYSSMRTIIFWNGRSLLVDRNLKGIKVKDIKVEKIYEENKNLIYDNTRLKNFMIRNMDRKFKKETDLNVFLYLCNVATILDMIDYLRNCEDEEFIELFRTNIKDSVRLLSIYDNNDFSFSPEVKKRGLF